MIEIEDQWVRGWLVEVPTRRRRLFHWLQANRHKSRYKFGQTPLRAVALIYGSRLLLVVSAPMSSAFYGSATYTKAGIVAFIILVAYWAANFLGRFWTTSKSGEEDAMSLAIVRAGDLLSRIDGRSLPDDCKVRSIGSCLGLIEAFVRHLIEGGKGEVSVALAVYTAGSSSQLRIIARNPGNERAVNDKPFDGDLVIGHYVARACNDPRPVYDLKQFPKKFHHSPTRSKVTYRSFMIFPLAVKDGDIRKVVGFISIDSPRPYAFYGNRADRITVACEAVVDHVLHLL
ncbi:hypothetical protein D1114_10130 [Cereibacter sphaeroides]|uniref:GAF domain-containing protein n=1 Tax=Cereibacter sphaeroides TaxID=1063 RepID=A0AAX1UL75_CERSP|nr:hypothetical protein [Cereibacter sphaeroides]RHZ95160.1 hypothetical protein D1114_10130 [Cereibacter sphaeroides]